MSAYEIISLRSPVVDKADLVKTVTKNLQGKTNKRLFSTTALLVINQFLYEINHSLLDKKTIVLKNFGLFQVVKAKARVGLNLDPKVRKIVHIPARLRIKFKPSPNVLKILRG